MSGGSLDINPAGVDTICVHHNCMVVESMSILEKPKESVHSTEADASNPPDNNDHCGTLTETPREKNPLGNGTIHVSVPTNTCPFSLEEISNSSYYYELLDTATTKSLTFFTCRHKVGERLACLNKLFVKLSQEHRLYSFGRVLYLVMLWKEGVAYINDLNEQETKNELECVQRRLSVGKNHLLQWLKDIAQMAVDEVVSKLNNNSLDILNSLAGDEEIVIINSYSYN